MMIPLHSGNYMIGGTLIFRTVAFLGMFLYLVHIESRQ